MLVTLDTLISDGGPGDSEINSSIIFQMKMSTIATVFEKHNAQLCSASQHFHLLNGKYATKIVWITPNITNIVKGTANTSLVLTCTGSR